MRANVLQHKSNNSVLTFWNSISLDKNENPGNENGQKVSVYKFVLSGFKFNLAVNIMKNSWILNLFHILNDLFPTEFVV